MAEGPVPPIRSFQERIKHWQEGQTESDMRLQF